MPVLEKEIVTSSTNQLDKQALHKKLYKEMLRIRLIEESIAKEYSKQQMRCPVHLSIGQEAIAVGVCKAIKKEDSVMSTHRAHAHYLAKNGNLNEMIAELHGKKTGCTSGKGGSMHLIDLEAGFIGSTPIVSSTLPVAVGLGFSYALKREEKVSVVFLGEGTTEEGVFSESLNFAALKNLPILFICENNLYSVYSSLDVRQPSNRDNVAIANSHGVAATRGDGNKVDEVYSLTKQALKKIRNKQGPIFLEFSTYRFREHCGPNYDNDLNYRTEEEYKGWEKKCPLLYSKTKLEETNSFLSKEEENKCKAAVQKEIQQAFTFAEKSPYPEEKELYTNVYKGEDF